MNNESDEFSPTGRSVLLGVTGGIAAYKAAELARLLTQAEYKVQTVMTESACQFIGPVTFQPLTGQPVLTELWGTDTANPMPHIHLSRSVSLILIAPASADFIGKLACGLADDLLSTLCLARDCPLMIAPAMNRQMWESPATQRNINRLQNDGVIIAGPASGEQACGETGMGRMLEVEMLLEVVQERLSGDIFQGEHILVTAGPTYEAIDPVRGITNTSSGKMGYAIAQAALEAGARVTLVTGPTCLKPPAVTKLIHVQSAHEMLAAVTETVDQTHADIFISVAAVADYRVVSVSQQKIKKSAQKLTLELIPNTDILSHIASQPNPPFCVGFAAETDNLEQNATFKRNQKKLPLLVANSVQEAMGSDETSLIVFDDQGAHTYERAPKQVLARQLIKHIALQYAQQNNEDMGV